jgi:hypothetical protein
MGFPDVVVSVYAMASGSGVAAAGGDMGAAGGCQGGVEHDVLWWQQDLLLWRSSWREEARAGLACVTARPPAPAHVCSCCCQPSPPHPTHPTPHPGLCPQVSCGWWHTAAVVLPRSVAAEHALPQLPSLATNSVGEYIDSGWPRQSLCYACLCCLACAVPVSLPVL